MGHHKSASKVALAVLVAVLSMTWSASAAPAGSDDVAGAGLPNSLENGDPALEKAIEWFRQEKIIRETATSLLGELKQGMDTSEFWEKMDRYVTNKYNELGLSEKWFSKVPPREEINKLRVIDAVLESKSGTPETLTQLLLDLSGINSKEVIGVLQKKSFKHALQKAIKLDLKENRLSENSLVDIANAIVRADKMAYRESSQVESAERISKHPLLKNKMLSKASVHSDKIKHFESALDAEIKVYGPRLRVDADPLPLNEANDRGLNVQGHNPCRNLATRRRRRSPSGCLFSNEEYGEIVREVETEGRVKEVLNTEKFLELMDRVATEDSADIKRKQLLELGTDLLQDPEVTLEGDYVAQFKEVVAPLDEAAIPSQMQDSIQRWQLPESPLGETHLVSESQAHPLDHLSLGDIHSADRIGVYPHQETFREPLSIHDPVIEPHENFHESPIIHNEEIFHDPVRPPGEIGGVFHEPMTNFQGEYKPVIMPEIIRPVEFTPIKTFPFPGFKWPTIPKITLPKFTMPKFTMPKFTMGKWG